MNPIEILSVGTKRPQYRSPVNFSESDLEAIAAAANAAGPIPFVPGHPANDEPRLGDATKIGVRDGKLVALEYALHPVIEDVVRSREMNRISVKLLPPGHSQNNTDTYLLKHIGLLGRSRPVDEDISEVQLASDEALFITMSTETPTPDVTEPTPEETTPPMTDPKPAASEDTTQIEEKLIELARRTEEIERRELIFSRAQAIAPFLDDLVANGKLLACEKPGFVALFSQVDSQEITLSSGDKTDTQKFLKEFLGKLPARVKLDGPIELSNPAPDAAANDSYEAEMAKVRAMYENARSN